MREEEVTKSIMNWLVAHGWEIICFDFPQSGTGRQLHPRDVSSKTYGIIIPDIVAIKDGKVLVFENKDRFVYSDFEKVYRLKNTDAYDDAWRNLLRGTNYSNIYFGIGIPNTMTNRKRALKCSDMVDFIGLIDEGGCLEFVSGCLL